VPGAGKPASPDHKHDQGRYLAKAEPELLAPDQSQAGLTTLQRTFC
jgi:hypothetical protein